MDDPDFPAISLYGSVLSGALSSAGYENVSRDIDMHKGLLVIAFEGTAGRENEYLASVLHIIEKLSCDEPEQSVFDAARSSEAGRYSAVVKDSASNEEFLFSSVLLGLDCTADDFAQAVSVTDAASVLAIARSIEPDMFTVCGIPE